MSWLPAAIGAAASLATGALGINASRDAEERSYKRSLDLMHAQNAFNVQMWKMANEYNSPSNQKKLLQEAGYNPAVYDVNGNGSQASEVTASSADVPNNSSIGELYSHLDPTDKVIQSLQTDYQIQKLRTDIQYQKLLNRDYSNELYWREQPFDLIDEFGRPVYDSDGNIEKRNYYQHLRGQQQLQTEALGLDLQHREALYNRQLMDNEVYQAGMSFLKAMPEKQLRSLEADIQASLLNNTLLSEDVELMRKYGISPHDKDGWQSFLKAILRNPDALGNVFDAFVPTTIQKSVRRLRGYGYSHSNPKPSSW